MTEPQITQLPEWKPPVTVDELPSKVIQIQAQALPGDYNSGPHITLFALCEDGSVWMQYHSSGYSNVPTDGRWYRSCGPYSKASLTKPEEDKS
jgi:hypothetical protein